MAEPPLTLEQVHARIFEGDPLAEDPSEVSFDGKVLAIAGIDAESGFRHDLRMTQSPGGVMLESKDPNSQDWDEWGCFDNFDALHAWIYEL